MLFYTLVVVFFFSDTILLNIQSKFAILASVLVMSAIFPILTIYVLYRWRMVRSIYLHTKKERIVPLIISSFSYILLAYSYISKLSINSIIVAIISATTFSLFIATFINFFHKISLHTLGVSGVLAILVWIQLLGEGGLIFPFIFFLVCVAVVMYSRLTINAHSLIEILSGFIVGFLAVFSYLYFFS